MTETLRAQRCRLAIPTLATLLALLPLTLGTTRGGIAEPHRDARADATVCDTTSPPAEGALILDLASASFDGFQDGAYRFEMAGFGNLSDELRENSASSPLVTIRIAPGPGLPLLDLRRGIEGGEAVSGVVDESGQPVAGAQLAVDRGPAGEAIFVASGLELGEGATWGAFTRFTAGEVTSTFVVYDVIGGELVCDKLDGAFVDDAPALPLDSGSPPAVPKTPTTASTERATDAPARDTSDDGDGFPWWVLFLFGGAAGLILLLLWIWPRLPRWFHRFREDHGSHGAPTTPPPEQTDFGE